MKKSLSKNAILSSVRVLANIIFPFITYPYITRVLSADGIGKVDFSNSVVNYFILIGALGIGTFATRAGAKIRDDKYALEKFASQIFTINCISCGFSFIMLFLLLILPTQLANYRILISLQGVGLIFAPMGVEWIYNIEEDFAYITARSILIQLISMILLFIFVHSYQDLYIYVAIRVFSSSFANIFNLVHSRKYVKICFTKDTNWRQYRKSIIVFFGNTITQTIYLNSDVTLLGLLTNDYYVGIYGVATKIYNIVKQVFNAAISVTIPRLSNYVDSNQSEFIHLLHRIIHFSMVLLTPAMLGLILFRKEIINLISGDGFLEATTTLIILAFALVFAIYANILNNAILVPMGKENKVLQGASISASLNCILNFIFIPLFKQNGAAFTTLIAELSMVLNAVVYMKIDIRRLIHIRDLLNTVMGCIMMTIMYTFSSYIGISHHKYLFIASIGICGITYLLCMIILKDYEICNIIKKLLFIKRRKIDE